MPAFFVVRSVVLPASARADFTMQLSALAAEEASIIVLLAEGFDGGIVRAILSEVCALVSYSCQWGPTVTIVQPLFWVSLCTPFAYSSKSL